MRLEAEGWQGSDIPANELETDYDGAMLPDDMLMNRDQGAILGTLYARSKALPLARNGQLTDCVFFRDVSRLRAVVFPYPGISVQVDRMLIERQAAEAIRSGLAAHVTPAMLAAARSPESHAQPAPALAHKHGHMRASVLLAEFFKAKSPGWGEATKIQMTGMCGVFVELMGDPTLSEIDGVKMHRYREQLLTLPRDLYQTRRRLKTATLAELVAAAGHRTKQNRSTVKALFAQIKADGYLGGYSQLTAFIRA